MILADIQRAETAVALIRREMRISIVSHITGIASKRLRSLSREIHGRRTPSGQLPSSGGILSTRTIQATASFFAALYRAAGGPRIFDTIDLEARIAAYDLYLELSRGLTRLTPSAAPIDITQAWVITRDIRIGVASFRRCQPCGIHYLIADDYRTALTCPVCALKKRGAAKHTTQRGPPPRQ